MIQAEDPLLLLENMTVRYQDKILFKDLNFVVKKGEHWAVVGESGAGKSALLQTIAGKFNSVGGKIKHYYFEDFVRNNAVKDPLFTFRNLIARVSAHHDFRNLSHTTSFYYQQRYNSYDSADAQRVSEYLTDIESAAHKQEAAPYWNYDRVIKTLGLEALGQKQLIKLSNGETKRLLIAASLLKNPLILLLDNPLTGLDKQTRLQFDAIIRLITQSGITVIMVTSPNEIPAALTHVAFIKEGEILLRVPREQFDPAVMEIQEARAPDIESLALLWKAGVKEQFDLLVGMKDVTVRYGENLILDKVDWCIKPGEHWALSGPNGSGKTTLLSLINGDNPQAYANKIILFDRKRGSGESIWDIKRKIGFVSPELHQYFPFENTCVQVIESGFFDTQGLFRKSNPDNKETALRWMRFFGIEKDSNTLFKDISSGRQRLCLLARALVKNPPLLILDEPCQGLDIVQQRYFRDIIDTICRLGVTTIIYVTHYREELPDCIERELRLQNGHVVSPVRG